MEDSGIDSGDHNGDNRDQQNRNVLFIRTANTDSSSSADSGSRSPFRTYATSPAILSPLPPPPQPAAPPTSRQLHRKLEARIENARRLHQQQQLQQKQNQHHQQDVSTMKHCGRKGSLVKTECMIAGSGGGGLPIGPGLLPLQRLNIPRAAHMGSNLQQLSGSCKDQQQPLVQWEDSDDSEEDIINFFPLSRKESKTHQEISDTFSIEELSISGDEDEEEDLHLVPPSTIYRTVTCCPTSSCTLL